MVDTFVFKETHTHTQISFPDKGACIPPHSGANKRFHFPVLITELVAKLLAIAVGVFHSDTSPLTARLPKCFVFHCVPIARLVCTSEKRRLHVKPMLVTSLHVWVFLSVSCALVNPENNLWRAQNDE